jgi:hypothetical protein
LGAAGVRCRARRFVFPDAGRKSGQRAFTLDRLPDEGVIRAWGLESTDQQHGDHEQRTLQPRHEVLAI